MGNMGSCVSSETRGEERNSYECEESGDTNRFRSIGAPFDFEFLRRGAQIGEGDLHRISRRMFLSGASKVASLYTQQGTRGVNQDAMLVWENFCSREDNIFCGVFDGHGPFGHLVSKKVRDSLPFKLYCLWKASFDESVGGYANSAVGSMTYEEAGSSSSDDDWSESLNVEESKKLPSMHLKLKHSLLKAFKLADEELKKNRKIDCDDSGCTAVALIKLGQEVIIGNVGDSRAVLGTRDKSNALVAIQLTVDLKPSLSREAARIQQRKGRVLHTEDERGVARVYLPNEDSPGLAMSRAFGDFCLKEYGLISVPEISYHHVTERDEFIILATDGVWDVLSNKEAVDIVASTRCRGTAAKALVDAAVKGWRIKFPLSKVDDCTVVCLLLDQPTAKETADGKSQRAVSGTWVEEAATTKHENLINRCQSRRSIVSAISTAEDTEWSALEGFTRVNSLVSLPRFEYRNENYITSR